ncbi:MAG: biopolymer transporter ExbD [Acidobacteriota bacterium]|nr:biopolymer transporter ExbD [Acidobacteriota bacterium]
MKKLVSKPPESEIPTSSMADIAFLLIIFFMVTAVFSATKGLDFKLPSDDKNQETSTEEAVFIKVAADGSLTVDCQPMELKGILPYLEPKLTRDAQKPVILYTDSDAPYSAMVAVYDVLGTPELVQDINDPVPNPWLGWKVKNISVPTQKEVAEYIELFGFNPFESHCE